MVRLGLLLALIVSNSVWAFHRIVRESPAAPSAPAPVVAVPSSEPSLEPNGKTTREVAGLAQNWRTELEPLPTYDRCRKLEALATRIFDSGTPTQTRAVLQLLAWPPEAFDFEPFRATVLDLARSDDDAMRYAALSVLIWQPPSREQTPILLDLTQDPSPSVRALAGRCLAQHIEGPCDGANAEAFVRLLAEENARRQLLATNWSGVRSLSHELEESLLTLPPLDHDRVCERVLRYIEPKTEKMVRFCLDALARDAHDATEVRNALASGVPEEFSPLIREAILALIETREYFDEWLLQTLELHGEGLEVAALQRLLENPELPARTRNKIEAHLRRQRR